MGLKEDEGAGGILIIQSECETNCCHTVLHNQLKLTTFPAPPISADYITLANKEVSY